MCGQSYLTGLHSHIMLPSVKGLLCQQTLGLAHEQYLVSHFQRHLLRQQIQLDLHPAASRHICSSW